jgi:excisionase family DNA binding protein
MKLLGFEGAAAELDISESTLRHLVAARRVPFTKIGRQVKFSEEHLEEIVRIGEHRPSPQLRGRRRAA